MYTSMTNDHAIEISKWQYSDEYSIYSFTENEETVAELLNGDYYVYVNENKLIGYICFEKSARIPTIANIYNEEFIDIGLGLNPSLCGRGNGYNFILNAIEFSKQNFKTSKFRLTVADFNKRAIKVYEKVGFKYYKTIEHKISNNKFNVMLLVK